MKNLILEKGKTIKDAILLLNENENGFLAIVDSNSRLIGILTDGDLRRGILYDKKELDSIINKNPTTMPSNTTKEVVLRKLREIEQRHMPLVDENNILTDIVTLGEDDFSIKKNHIFILAGGLGKRMGKLTKETPKVMLPVGSKPILEHIMVSFINQNFTNFIISVKYKSESIKEYFGDGSKLGVHINYIEEENSLGTGGSLSLIKDDFSEPMIVINGDIMTTLDFSELINFHKENNSHATMCVKKSDFKLPYGVVDLDNDGNILNFNEKPNISNFINCGIYVFEPEVLKFIPKNKFFDLPELFQILIEKNFIVKSFCVSDYWNDIGNPVVYKDLSDKFLL